MTLNYKQQKKKTHRGGNYFFKTIFKILFFLQTIIKRNAKDAPKKFARTSIKSALLVVVNTLCNISIMIPNKIEIDIEIKKGFKIKSDFSCL